VSQSLVPQWNSSGCLGDSEIITEWTSNGNESGEQCRLRKDIEGERAGGINGDAHVEMASASS
jgi:hypothetical protein